MGQQTFCCRPRFKQLRLPIIKNINNDSETCFTLLLTLAVLHLLGFEELHRQQQVFYLAFQLVLLGALLHQLRVGSAVPGDADVQTGRGGRVWLGFSETGPVEWRRLVGRLWMEKQQEQKTLL